MDSACTADGYGRRPGSRPGGSSILAGHGIERSARSLGRRTVIRREDGVDRLAAWRHVAGPDHGVAGMDVECDAERFERGTESALTQEREGADVLREMHGAHIRAPDEVDDVGHGVTLAGDESAAKSDEGALEICQGLGQEPVAVGRATEEPRIEHEERDDASSRPGGGAERRMIVDAQVAREQDDVGHPPTVGPSGGGLT